MSITIHRFTPPTCTLEIKRIKPLFPLWIQSAKLSNWQFQLDFDDPRLPIAKQVKITGNEQDLIQIELAVNHYVQEFLQASFKENIELEINKQANYNKPYLQPEGLVNHQLFLGNLTHNHTNKSIQLSTVQLFDLVTALEAYQTQITNQFTLNSTKSNKHISLWSGITALLIAAIGITTVVLREPESSNVTSSPKSQSSEEIPQLDDIVPPQVPKTTIKSVPKPESLELASQDRLPPPPSVDTPKPKPDIPDPADYPLAEIARQSGLKNTIKQSSTSGQQSKSVITIPTETILQKDNNAQNIPPLETENNPSENQELARLNSLPPKSPVKPDQLQEVKAYFEGKWQPPTELKQSLEYRLELNNDGSVKRIIPLGKASQLYLNQTNIPLQGEAFISPLAKSQTSTIRLLLNPDGGVQTFTE